MFSTAHGGWARLEGVGSEDRVWAGGRDATTETSSPGTSTLKEAKEALEREILENALRENGGNISKTAKDLGISRPTLYDLMSRYGL